MRVTAPRALKGPKGRTRGGALAAVVILLPAILLGLAAFSQRALTEMRGARQGNRSARALCIAHAGLQLAGRRVMDNPDYRGEVGPAPFGGGDYSCRVEGDEAYPELGRRVRITATGAYRDPAHGEARRHLKVIANPVRRSVLDFAVSAGSRIAMESGAQVGNPWNRENVVYAGNTDPTTEHESIRAVPVASLYGSGEVATSVNQTSPPRMDPGPIEYEVRPLEFPTYDLGALREKARRNTRNRQYPAGAFFRGDKVFRNETLRGIIFVEGAVSLEGLVFVDGGCIVQSGPEDFTVGGDAMGGPVPGPLAGPLPGPLAGRMPGRIAGRLPGPPAGPLAGPLPGPTPGNLIVIPDMDPVAGAPHVAIVKLGGGAVRFLAGSFALIDGFVFSDGRIDFDAAGVVMGGLVTPGDVELGGSCTVYSRTIGRGELAEEVSVPTRWSLDVVSWVEE